MTPRLLLVGMMGAGKTTTGHLLAEELGWGYRDSDADVEAATGLTVPELFARDGEAAFRQAEADVLAQACADPAPSVVSVAGGAVLRPENRRLIAGSGWPVATRIFLPSPHTGGDGQGLRLRPLGAVLGTALLAIGHSDRVQRAANHVIPHARQILYTAAADQHNRVLLQVVADAGDVGGHLNPVRQTHTGNLAQRRIRLLGRLGINACTYPALLRT